MMILFPQGLKFHDGRILSTSALLAAVKTDFKRSYQKIGDFWLQESNESETKVRIFGTAVLTIKYGEYQITQAHNLNPASDVESELSHGQ